MFMRSNNRRVDQLRPVKITRNYTKYAEGSVLIEFGETKVLCNASIDESLPPFLKDKNQGWLTAEYSMLPRATHLRTKRDAVIGKVNSRASEISRLIGRSLRACIDLTSLGPRQVLIDCDVIQADGGTRTAAITGSFIALQDAVARLMDKGKLELNPIKHSLAAISVGAYQNELLLDLDYNEDSACDMDMNVVMLGDLSIVEIQGTAEGRALDRGRLNLLLDLAQAGITELIRKQARSIDSVSSTE